MFSHWLLSISRLYAWQPARSYVCVKAVEYGRYHAENDYLSLRCCLLSGLSRYVCNCCFHYCFFCPASGRRKGKANAFNAGFHLVNHRI